MHFLVKTLLLLMLLQFVTACKNLKRMLPEGPALTIEERQSILAQKGHKVKYTGAPEVAFPILPVQVWAATYELDLILVSKNPDWNMHEYAKLETPNGDLWVMKDAEEGSLDQYIVADLPDINSWLPELPVVRKSYPVKVEDKSTEKMLDMSFSYENIKGEKVEAWYQGKRPKTELKKKNGSTMGHSRNQLLVALNLPYRDFGKKASISYDGKSYKMDKLLGLVPFQMALTQTQGGISSGTYEMEIKGEGILTTAHPSTGKPTIQNWIVERKKSQTIVTQKNDFRSLVYEFEGTETLELKAAYVMQWNKEKAGVYMTFSPALPDLRRPFDGVYTSSFIMDIAGQNNNATGTITVRWNNGKAELSVIPTKPWWVTDRPMLTQIEYKGGKALVDIEMLPDPNKTGVEISSNFNASPEKVMQTIFEAAQNGKFESLPQLLPPKGQGSCDGDCLALCYPGDENMKKEVGHNYITREQFKKLFSNSKIIEDPVINKNSANVKFSFGEKNEKTEVMNLQKIDGKWYLESF